MRRNERQKTEISILGADIKGDIITIFSEDRKSYWINSLDTTYTLDDILQLDILKVELTGLEILE